jgi:hypothetical protein
MSKKKKSALTKWQAPIPQPIKQRDRKRCYTIWTQILGKSWGGGKVVWLTDKQLTFARIKYPYKEFEEVLERDSLEEYKKYLNQTIN